MKRTLLALACMLGAAGANATTIDFNQVIGFQTTGNPYQEDGFQIVNSNGSSGALLFWGTSSFNADPNGNTLSHNYQNSTMTLTKIGGGAFNFNSIDLTDVYNTGAGGRVQFNFQFADTTTSQSFVSVDMTPGLETFAFNLTNLTQVAWTPLTTEGPWLQLDNIVVDGQTSHVPEPATVALLGLGLAGLGLMRRRKA